MSINKFVQIKDTPNLYRDVHSKSLVSTDDRGLEEYKAARELRRESQVSLLQYQNDINKLKDEVTEIKNSLKLILQSLNG